MTVTHANASYKGSLVLNGTEVEFRALDTVINKVIDALIIEAADKLIKEKIDNPKLIDLCNVGTLKMAYRIKTELLSLIQDLVAYRTYDSFEDFLKWEEEYEEGGAS